MNNKLQKHGVTILYIATIAGLGLSFLGSVLNSKLLSKEMFGDWKYIQNYLMMVSFLVNFGFYFSGGRLIASTDDPNRIATFKGFMLYKCLLGLFIMFAITIVIGLFWTKVLNENIFNILLIMFPLFIVQPLMFYLEAIFQAERKLLSYSIYKFLPPFLYVACLYIFKAFSTGNIYFNAILFYITYLIIFIVFLAKDKIIFKRKGPELQELIKENKVFGSHLYYGSLWNVGAVYLLPILIGYFNLNNAEVGIYSLALSFVIPFSFLPTVVGTSYFKEFIKLDKVPPEAFKKVFYISMGLLLFTIVGIDYCIDIFLGVKYKEVAMLVKIGAIGAIIQGFGDFINKFLSAKGESPYIKKVSMVQGTVLVITSLVLIRWYSSVGAIISKNIGSTIYLSCLYYYYNKNYLKKKSEEVLV
jgi:O-antigen/teichoic acid export membrane protein